MPASHRFAFARRFRGGEVIAEAGTLIAADGEHEIRTPPNSRLPAGDAGAAAGARAHGGAPGTLRLKGGAGRTRARSREARGGEWPLRRRGLPARRRLAAMGGRWPLPIPPANAASA